MCAGSKNLLPGFRWRVVQSISRCGFMVCWLLREQSFGLAFRRTNVIGRRRTSACGLCCSAVNDHQKPRESDHGGSPGDFWFLGLRLRGSDARWIWFPGLERSFRIPWHGGAGLLRTADQACQGLENWSALNTSPDVSASLVIRMPRILVIANISGSRSSEGRRALSGWSPRRRS